MPSIYSSCFSISNSTFFFFFFRKECLAKVVHTVFHYLKLCSFLVSKNILIQFKEKYQLFLLYNTVIFQLTR